MTTTTAVPAFGSALQRYNGSSYVTVTNVSNIQPSGPKRKFVDTSQMQGGGWEEMTPTLNAGGTLTADIDFVDSDPTHQSLKSDQLNATLSLYRMVFPDAIFAGFSAYVESIVPDLKVSDVVKGKLILQITGAVTW